MDSFDTFLKKHGPAIDCRPAEARTSSTYRKILPAELVELWEQTGFCGYGKGHLWVVNPDELIDVLADWFPKTKDKKIPIVRTAFGDVVFWDRKGAHVLEVQYGNVHFIGTDASVLFWYWLCDDKVLKNILKAPLFKAALKKLGPLAHDECYAFKLALALGGDDSVDNLTKVKLREQLSILSQVARG